MCALMHVFAMVCICIFMHIFAAEYMCALMHIFTVVCNVEVRGQHEGVIFIFTV